VANPPRRIRLQLRVSPESRTQSPILSHDDIENIGLDASAWYSGYGFANRARENWGRYKLGLFLSSPEANLYFEKSLSFAGYETQLQPLIGMGPGRPAQDLG
jgi:hypothetical protein